MPKEKKPIIDPHDKETLRDIVMKPSSGVFDMEGVENPNELNAKIQKLIKFFQDYGIDYNKLDEENIKTAYPNYDQYMNIPGQHNLKKWLDAVRNIHVGERGGLDRVHAVRQATSGWNPMETYDFLNWMRFYQEGAHMKYKTAQLWYENGQPGYFLQIKPDAPKPPEPTVDHAAVADAREDVARQEEKKKVIEKQRQKIIGRLDSAEKLLRSPEGQMFAGTELENLMEAIYSLKKKVQLVNKLSTSTRLYEDMIVREGNVLRKRGFVKAAEVLYTIAQANNPPPPGIGQPGPIDALPSATPPDDPSGAGHPGLPGTLPSEGPGMPVGQKSPPSISENQPVDPKARSGPEPTAGMQEPTIMPQDAPKSKGISEFLEGTETGGKTDSEELDADKLEIDDTLQVHDEDLMVSEAQMAPPGPPPDEVPMTTTPSRPKPAAPPPPDDKPLEVTEDAPPANEAGVPDAAGPAKDFDRIIDSALANVTVTDVVAKLEDIAKIFKTREIPRQLSLVDMMLDSLGLAAMFPTLSEAINKSLESNNYVATRLDDIIARLRGAMGGKDMNLRGGDTPPRAGGIAANLQEQTDKEDARKKMRKEQEAAELGAATKESPQVDVGGDLGGPAPPPAAAPPPPRPLG
jgi:hypothetical protein